MKGARILVTGGTGFIGSNLLYNKPARASYTVLARKKPKDVSQYNQFIEADIRSFKIPKGEYTHIIHAAEAGPEATKNVVESGAKVLLISSGACYFSSTPYADTKLASEQLVLDNNGIVCRLFSFMGPNIPLNGKFAAGNFIRDALMDDAIHIRGDGTQIRSYMHTQDMANWVWTILHRGKPGKIYDVGSAFSVNLLWLAEEIAKQAEKKVNRKVDVELDCAVTRGLAPTYYVPQSLVPAHQLKLEVNIGIKDAISKTMDWAIESLL